MLIEQAGIGVLAVAGDVSAHAGERVIQHTEHTVGPSDSLIYEEDV